SMFNITSSDVTPVGGPTSYRDTLKNYDTGEYNTYRAKEFSSALMLTHPTNHLAYARHPEVVDVAETAQFGKPRGFLPLDGGSDRLLAKGRKNRIADTAAFNKGYKAHFEGRKYASVSKNSPFTSSADQNTLMFSELYSSNSFYNGYRDFHGMNQSSFNKELGAINKLVPHNSGLIAVHSKGVTHIPINESALLQNSSGQDIRIGSFNLLPEKTAIISSEFGSAWSRSIIRTDNSVYGIDVSRHKIWMLSGRSLDIISDGKVNRLLAGFLTDFVGKKEVPGELYISSSYNTLNNDVTFSFYNKNSRFISRAVEMDIQTYYMLYDMMIEGILQDWIIAVDDKLAQVDRKILVEQFLKIVEYAVPVKGLTLVYNENTRNWVSRLSYSPEFAFTIDDKHYTINNKDTALGFTNENLFDSDASRQLIWSHNDVNPLIPSFGSFYGANPIFEVEFIINANPKNSKAFHEMDIVGSEALPAKVIYQISEDCPWFNVLIDTSDFAHQTDKQRADQYLDLILAGGHSGDMSVVNPNTYIVQNIFDRRYFSILKANYSYLNGFGRIKINKNLSSMYADGPNGMVATKHMNQKLHDKYLRVRLSYTSGKYLYIKYIKTTYQ
ncbi:MAG: hypothetical protein PF450_08900, partial [Bacteroidales bacterium]|nr:hypothetical protein [Bacteroidales bacterium]